MILGRVIGRAVSTRKDEKLIGTKLLLIEEIDPKGTGTGDLAVVGDNLGAGAGDVVLVTQGSAARFTAATKDRPIDALVVGIVDIVSVGGKRTFAKDRGFAKAAARR